MTISKSSKTKSSKDNLIKLVTATNSILTKAGSQISDGSSNLSADQKRRLPKLRKGAERILPQLGTLLQKHGLDGGPISVAQILGGLQDGQTLAPLQQGLTGLLKQVEDRIAQSHASSVKMASHGYAILQSMARDDGDLAASLEPISDFFAYRHSSVTEEKAPKQERKTEATMKKASSLMAGRVERAQKTIARAAALTTSASTQAASPPPAVTTAPASVTTAAPATTVAPTH